MRIQYPKPPSGGLNQLEQITMKSDLEIYLEWVNDWLTVERMADYYSMTIEQMLERINNGREEAQC